MKRVSADQLEYPGDGLYYLQGSPFTGIAYRLHREGTLRSELEYRDGLRWGMSREWYGPEQPMVEAPYFKGVLHGRAREWHRNGQLAEDGEYEYGIALWEQEWDEDGTLTSEHRLSEAEPDYETLRRYRELYGRDSDASPDRGGG